jgi:hypothetical protein
MDAINCVADARSQSIAGDPFRLMQQQVIAVGQRRLELWQRMAELERPQQLRS